MLDRCHITQAGLLIKACASNISDNSAYEAAAFVCFSNISMPTKDTSGTSKTIIKIRITYLQSISF